MICYDIIPIYNDILLFNKYHTNYSIRNCADEDDDDSDDNDDGLYL